MDQTPMRKQTKNSKLTEIVDICLEKKKKIDDVSYCKGLDYYNSLYLMKTGECIITKCKYSKSYM